MMGRPPSRDLDKFMLRLPDGMREALKTRAEKNGRTTTAEIVARLQWSLDVDDEFAQYELASEARSKLAAERILKMGMSAPSGGYEERFKKLEDRVTALENKNNLKEG